MNRKTLALIAAFSLATTVSAAGAADLDEVSEAIDLDALAQLILMEYLNLGDPSSTDVQDESYALAIGFTFGVAFTSDTVSFTDAFADGLLVTGSDPDSAGYIGTLAETLAGPGVAGVITGLNLAVVNPPDPPLVLSTPAVSPD